jgi:serine/threonine protein kinase
MLVLSWVFAFYSFLSILCEEQFVPAMCCALYQLHLCGLFQPERIDPQRARGYDVRSDVWSLGITLMEVATGHFPYPKWNSVFEQLFQVVQGDPPRLSPNENGNHFSTEFVNFVNTW